MPVVITDPAPSLILLVALLWLRLLVLLVGCRYCDEESREYAILSAEGDIGPGELCPYCDLLEFGGGLLEVIRSPLSSCLRSLNSLLLD